VSDSYWNFQTLSSLLGYILPPLNTKTYTWYTGWGVTKKSQSHVIKFIFPKFLYVNNMYMCQGHALCGAKATQRAKTGWDIVVVCAPSWASACSRLICEDALILNSAAASLTPNIVPCWVGVAGALPPSQTAADPPIRASCGSSLASSYSFSSFFLIFLFQNHFSWSHWIWGLLALLHESKMPMHGMRLSPRESRANAWYAFVTKVDEPVTVRPEKIHTELEKTGAARLIPTLSATWSVGKI